MSPARRPPDNDVMSPDSRLGQVIEKVSFGITHLTRNVLYPTVIFTFKVGGVILRNGLWFLASFGAVLTKSIAQSLERLKSRL